MKNERITTDDPKGNFETLMNYCYGKDKIAHLRYAGGKYDTPLHEYIAGLCIDRGCIEKRGWTAEELDEEILEDLDCCDCPIGIMYYLACQAVQTRGVLKKYEDEREKR